MRITLINDRNKVAFSPLLVDLRPTGDTLAFGALTEMAGGYLASGAIRASVRGNIAEITSFYVAPDYRGNGIGSALLAKLLDALIELGTVDRVYAVMCTDVKNAQSLSDFFKKEGFGSMIQSGTVYSIKIPDFIVLRRFYAPSRERDSAMPVNRNILPFKSMPEKAVERVNTTFRQISGLFNGPLTLGRIDGDISYGYVSGGEISGCCIMSSDEQRGIITLETIAVRGELSVLVNLLHHSLNACADKYGDRSDWSLRFAAVTPETQKLAERIDKRAEFERMPILRCEYEL